MSTFLERYAIDKSRLLGGGAVGEVYVAYDRYEQREVAIKRAKEQWLHKFTLKREYDLVSAMPVHPNIVSFYDYAKVRDGSELYEHIVMPYYSEGSLGDLHESEQLKGEDLRHAVEDLLQGVQHLHNNQLIHRDLKPSNILLERLDNRYRLVITDYGIGKLIEGTKGLNTSPEVGTLRYMAPEQHKAEDISFKADLWAAGIIIYELVTGQTAYPGRGTNVALAISRGELPAKMEQLPAPYKAIVSACLVYQPEERAASSATLLDMLKSNTGKQRKNTNSEKIRWLAKSKVRFVIPALALLLLVGSYGGYQYYQQLEIERIIAECCDPIAETDVVTPVQLDANRKAYVEEKEQTLRKVLAEKEIEQAIWHSWDNWLDNPTDFELSTDDISHLDNNFEYNDVWRKQRPLLFKLLIESKSMDDYEEKQSWLSLMDDMDTDQMDKLYDILYKERSKLNDILKAKIDILPDGGAIIQEVKTLLEPTKNYKKLAELCALIKWRTDTGWYYLLAGDLKKAEEYTLAAIQKEDALAAKYNRALLLMLSGQQKRSFEEYKKLLMDLDTTYNQRHFFNASIDDIKTFTRRKDIQFNKSYTRFILGLHYFYGTDLFPAMKEEYIRAFRCFVHTVDEEEYSEELTFCKEKLSMLEE